MLHDPAHPAAFSTICTAIAPDDVLTFRTNGATC
jgi:hypothetical protein